MYMNLLKWNLYTQQQTVAEGIPMQEVHIVLLYDRELQSLQNMYNSATSAISSNIRKNKAKIKYNTIVYLINSEDAR